MNTHYTIRGGTSRYGVGCGTFDVHANNVVGLAVWDLGAALSFKLLIIIYHSSNMIGGKY